MSDSLSCSGLMQARTLAAASLDCAVPPPSPPPPPFKLSACRSAATSVATAPSCGDLSSSAVPTDLSSEDFFSSLKLSFSINVDVVDTDSSTSIPWGLGGWALQLLHDEQFQRVQTVDVGRDDRPELLEGHGPLERSQVEVDPYRVVQVLHLRAGPDRLIDERQQGLVVLVVQPPSAGGGIPAAQNDSPRRLSSSSSGGGRPNSEQAIVVAMRRRSVGGGVPRPLPELPNYASAVFLLED
mmetsp:Transcript_55451/g.166271  ORF Transcript_55451/g.166271 Transcript_55451/m.166271 type:complete len:240 (+) Transcript_55451:1501-2220(+)